MTQAVILAAGRGSRMLTTTQNQPKCMVRLAGKTLLEWQIEALKKAGIKDVFVVGGYFAHLLENTEYHLLLNSDWNQSNMVSSLCCAQEILKQKETIISYADIVYNPEIITKLLNSSKDISITYDLLWQDLWQERFDNPLEDIEKFRIHEGEILEIGGRPSSLKQVEGKYMGLLKLTPNGWSHIYEVLNSMQEDRRRKIDMTTLLQYLIKSNISIYGVPISGKWCEVDCPEDLYYYEQRIKETKKWTHDWRM